MHDQLPPEQWAAQHILGIYETHLPVRDLDQSLAFYCGQLGLPLARRLPERNVAFLWAGPKETGMLGLWGAGSAPLSMRLHFAFRATKEAVLQSFERLPTQGITPLGFNGAPADEPVVLGWMPAVSVYFKDPDGHSIEMLHLLDEAPDADFGVGGYSAWENRKHR
ncbi:VOC family protein [Phaeobacter gallaeciensis]|uniref:VOC family protein n=1 Tax=Phaeobacter gallaeciensis TaxID=60890 RepID=UPI00237EFF47|nr:VOC family protein [Phaeobacter gallaeciensis]MDE4303241.1 VOC family protein [Phaeobacter gallaeciensis]MDE4307633.1 VOC family protein [Phaeobacter gallaeciensis]MDE4312091.1 VOC family protein [Phaeobacter gallaeciensis]MDE4316404.1 VOC family protein [Phaeobacter gallaeciensis]MDE4321025.1 VOC family protein [Phaeobacter gallaeciensis]